MRKELPPHTHARKRERLPSAQCDDSPFCSPQESDYELLFAQESTGVYGPRQTFAIVGQPSPGSGIASLVHECGLCIELWRYTAVLGGWSTGREGESAPPPALHTFPAVGLMVNGVDCAAARGAFWPVHTVHSDVHPPRAIQRQVCTYCARSRLVYVKRRVRALQGAAYHCRP